MFYVALHDKASAPCVMSATKVEKYWIERYSFHTTDSEIRFGKSFLCLYYYEEMLWTRSCIWTKYEAATTTIFAMREVFVRSYGRGRRVRVREAVLVTQSKLYRKYVVSVCDFCQLAVVPDGIEFIFFMYALRLYMVARVSRVSISSLIWIINKLYKDRRTYYIIPF